MQLLKAILSLTLVVMLGFVYWFLFLQQPDKQPTRVPIPSLEQR